MKKLRNNIIAASLSLILTGVPISQSLHANASEVSIPELTENLVNTPDVQKVVTEYSDLWTGVYIIQGR